MLFSCLNLCSKSIRIINQHRSCIGPFSKLEKMESLMSFLSLGLSLHINDFELILNICRYIFLFSSWHCHRVWKLVLEPTLFRAIIRGYIQKDTCLANYFHSIHNIDVPYFALTNQQELEQFKYTCHKFRRLHCTTSIPTNWQKHCTKISSRWSHIFTATTNLNVSEK